MIGISRGRARPNGLRGIAVAAAAITVALPGLYVVVPAPAAAQAATAAPRWFGPGAGPAAQQLVQLLATAQADGLNPRRYNVKGLTRAVAAAQ
jgi:hypothetical protein